MAKTMSIPDRLRAHPDIVMRRSAPLVWTGIAIAVALLATWVYVLQNGPAVQALFASGADSARVSNRVMARFGVLILLVLLPVFAWASASTLFYLSRRYARRATGTRVKRTYKGVFATGAGAGQAFYDQLRTRDPQIIGTMNEGTDQGNLVIEGWSADADRVAYVAVFEFSDRGPGWDLVEFAGDDFDTYTHIFRAGRS